MSERERDRMREINDNATVEQSVGRRKRERGRQREEGRDGNRETAIKRDGGTARNTEIHRKNKRDGED